MELRVLKGLGKHLNICKYILFEFNVGVPWSPTDGSHLQEFINLLDGYTINSINSSGELQKLPDNYVENTDFNKLKIKNSHFVAVNSNKVKEYINE